MIVLRLFKMSVKPLDCSSLNKLSFIIFLVAEKCKQREIWRKMCDVYAETCFRKKKIFINGLTWVCHNET